MVHVIVFVIKTSSLVTERCCWNFDVIIHRIAFVTDPHRNEFRSCFMNESVLILGKWNGSFNTLKVEGQGGSVALWDTIIFHASEYSVLFHNAVLSTTASDGRNLLSVQYRPTELREQRWLLEQVCSHPEILWLCVFNSHWISCPGRLEMFCRDLTQRFADVWVVSGPLMLPQVDENGKKTVSYQVMFLSFCLLKFHGQIKSCI